MPTKKGDLPKHIGIIMDGNRRWALKRGKQHFDGLKAGFDNVRNVVALSVEKGIKHLTLYAFSTENWSRPGDELRFVEHLAQRMDIDDFVGELQKYGVKFRHLGRKDRLNDNTKLLIEKFTSKTKLGQKMVLSVAFDYGGRDDIVGTIKKMATEGFDFNRLDEQIFGQNLISFCNMPVDLIIRSGGEYRISNFMLWDAAYAELYFTDVLWPDFGRDEFTAAVDAYQKRERRFGRL